jgi:D-3-phosphoglycerate dehydrogenase
MKTILVATEKPFAASAVKGIEQIISDAGFQLKKLEKYSSKADLLKAVADVNAIIIRSDIIDKEVMDAAPNLEIVVRAGAGFDNIDIASASEKNIVAMNTPGQNSNAVAELVIGMMIYMNRNRFDGSTGVELLGKKLGIHGYGNVGRNIARIAEGLGMEVYAFDPFLSQADVEKTGAKYAESVEALYAQCQYISLNIPANAQTKGSINYELLNKMPEGATVVNSARKEIIDEAGMLKLFADRKDFRYISDVAPDNAAELTEKYAARYFCTPKKMGAQTSEANNNAGLAAANQIVNYFVKGDTTFQLNKKK